MRAQAGRDVGPGSGRYDICLSRNQVRTLFHRGAMDSEEVARRQLGCGSWACVWEREDGRAIKITRDPEDVAAFQAVEGIPHIVKMYKAYQLADCCTDDKTGKGVTAYAMVMQKVKPITPTLERWIKHTLCRTRLSVRLDVTRQQNQPKEQFKISRMTREKVERACVGAEESPKKQAACTRFGHSLLTTFERMYRRGVDWIDMNENNIGVDNQGKWAALDLGMSDVPLSERPIVLHGGGKPPRCKIIR